MESTEFRLLRHNRYLKYVLAGFAALLLFVSMTRGGDLACAFKTCVVFPGGKMTPSHASEVINSCDKFTDRNAGAYAIKMSQSEINDIYMQYGISNPIIQADSALRDLMKSPLEFERDWENLNYLQISYACNGLKSAYYNRLSWR